LVVNLALAWEVVVALVRGSVQDLVQDLGAMEDLVQVQDLEATGVQAMGNMAKGLEAMEAEMQELVLEQGLVDIWVRV